MPGWGGSGSVRSEVVGGRNRKGCQPWLVGWLDGGNGEDRQSIGMGLRKVWNGRDEVNRQERNETEVGWRGTEFL